MNSCVCVDETRLEYSAYLFNGNISVLNKKTAFIFSMMTISSILISHRFCIWLYNKLLKMLSKQVIKLFDERRKEIESEELNQWKTFFGLVIDKTEN